MTPKQRGVQLWMVSAAFMVFAMLFAGMSIWSVFMAYQVSSRIPFVGFCALTVMFAVGVVGVTAFSYVATTLDREQR